MNIIDLLNIRKTLRIKKLKKQIDYCRREMYCAKNTEIKVEYKTELDRLKKQLDNLLRIKYE